MAATLRHDAPGALLGTVFSMAGLCAIILSQFRRPQRDLTLVSFGVFCSLYGVRLLASLTSVQVMMGRALPWPFLLAFITYTIGVPANLFNIQLLGPGWRSSLRVLFWLSVAFACIAVFSDVLRGMPFTMRIPNGILVIVGGTIVLINLFRPGIPVSPELWALRAGFAILAVFVLVENLRGLGVILDRTNYEPLGFTAFVGALGFVAARRFLDNEKQLLALKSELATAQRIQSAVLPHQVPAVEGIEVAARYIPMAAVAGDFYDFLPIDDRRLGILVADVSGHGVPAALIAAMMKMAVQSIVPCAHSPADVLQGLNRMLSGQAPDQFVTAAYLFIDTQNYKACYSAAGHPPLLLSRRGTLHRIESNGLVFGVTPQPDYPVRDIPIYPGDRFLLYTDGVIEPENAKGKAFGDSKLEQVVLDTQMHSPSDLADRLLTEIRSWQPASMNQQDDITLVVIDVR